MTLQKYLVSDIVLRFTQVFHDSFEEKLHVFLIELLDHIV